jgi:hypothetical protein
MTGETALASPHLPQPPCLLCRTWFWAGCPCPGVPMTKSFLNYDKLVTRLSSGRKPLPSGVARISASSWSFPKAFRNPGSGTPSPEVPVLWTSCLQMPPSSLLLRRCWTQFQRRNSCGVRPADSVRASQGRPEAYSFLAHRGISEPLSFHPTVVPGLVLQPFVSPGGGAIWLDLYVRKFTLPGWRMDWTQTDMIREREGKEGQDFPVPVPACLALTWVTHGAWLPPLWSQNPGAQNPGWPGSRETEKAPAQLFLHTLLPNLPCS